MTNEIAVRVGFKYDKTESDKSFSSAEAALIEANKKWEAIVNAGWADLSRESDKAWRMMADGSIKTVGDALGQSVVLGIKGGLDQAGPVWEKAWNTLLSIPEKALGTLLSNLGAKLLDLLADTFSGKLIAPLLDGLGLKSALEGIFTSTATTIGSWLGVGSVGWPRLAPRPPGLADSPRRRSMPRRRPLAQQILDRGIEGSTASGGSIRPAGTTAFRSGPLLATCRIEHSESSAALFEGSQQPNLVGLVQHQQVRVPGKVRFHEKPGAACLVAKHHATAHALVGLCA